MQLAGIRQDLIGGVRGLLRAPGFALAALLTLGLGIGATSAVFAVVKAVLLTPLPYAHAETRVLLWSRWISFDKTWLSDQEILDYRRLARTLSAVAGWTTTEQNLTGDGEPESVSVGLLTANTFDVLGATPLAGRPIASAEDEPHAAPVAVLGYALWQSRYGGDPAIVGRRILLDDEAVEVVGVMPEGFRLPTDFSEDAARPTQLWRALQLNAANAERGSHGYYAAAVLAPGASAASATSELRALTAAMTDQGLYPAAMRFSAFATSLDDELRGAVRPAMWLLMGAVACLLLIACANVANLLLVRGDARIRELAVRSAIGATTERLVRQLLTESVVLAVTGSALGLTLAAGGVRVLLALDPASLPPLTPVALDATVVVFTFALAVVTTLIFGLLPALRSLRLNLVESLREGSQQATAGGARQRLRGALVVAEVVLAVVLVIGASLMARSLGALGRVPLGFNPDRVLTMRVALPSARYDSPEKVVDFYRHLVGKVRTISGVTAAGVVRALPLATTIGDRGVDVDGFVESPGRTAKGDWQIVSDGAFEAMGMRLAAGRWLTAADTSASQPVVVVNETMARTYWPDGRAVGGRVRIGGSDTTRPKAVVVGIVADERHNGVTAAPKEKFYAPHSQWHVLTGGNVVRSAYVVIRTAGNPLAVSGPAREAVRGLDPSLPVSGIRTMRAVVDTALGTPRLTGFLLAAFATIALVLAVVGLYGVLSYVVARRTHEIGIRLAMGASRGHVLGMVLRHGLTLALLGIGGGLAVAATVSRLMRGLLYQVTPLDPFTFATVSVTLLAVAALASLLPALRALRLSPTLALRME
ncbi:MAG TPA: ABC transporter permease [Vicinamibacterales bacterium]|nr:ABC transporter permease [Vicinamibacterales bacterium]